MKSIYLLKPYLIEKRLAIFAGVVCLIAVDMFQLYLPRLIKRAVDDLTAFRIDLAGLSLYALYMVCIALMIGMFRYGWLRCFVGMSRRVEEGLRNQLFEHVQTLSPSYFDKTKTGDLMAHASNDMLQVRMATGIGVVTVIDTIFMGTAAIAFMAYINVTLTLFALAPMPLVVLASWYFSKKMHLMYGEVQETFSELTEVVRERIAGIRIIKAYNREKDSLSGLEKISGEYVSNNLKLAKITGSFSPMITFFSNMSLAVIICVGGRQTILTDISAGDFVAFSSYMGLLMWPITAIGTVTNLVQRGKASLDRINKILETRPDIADVPNATSVREIKNDIVFENIMFSYNGNLEAGDRLQGAGGRLQVSTLSEINLKIERGMTLGIIGPPGSGKTTLLSLLPRFYDVRGGRILIDGTDIRDFKLCDLRTLISFMPQEPFLFAGTIRENIMFGNDKAQEADLIKAAESAALYDTIRSFPEGFETVVGERGVILSGGQKQRIALARALIRKSPVLILDDPISQVDAETANFIINTIQSEAEERTVLIVSHRLSALRFADRIITLKEGLITESGTHGQLAQQEESYYAKTLGLQQIEEELNAF